MECRKLYCNRCCRDHKETNDNHIVFQTQHIAGNNRKTKCEFEKCGYRAERFCTVCWKTYCTSCTQNHQCGQKGLIIINQRYKPVAITELEHLYNLSFHTDRVSICGIAFLEDDTVVTVDGKNRRLIVFKSKEQIFKGNLEKKPESMTAMTGNEFAVTYPEENFIQIYNLTQNKTKNTCRILKVKPIDTPGKPFSIAYHHGKFVIGVVEGKGGVIYIIDIGKNKIMKMIHSIITLYTGHRLRLALDRNRIFVSDMENVNCYNYEGKKLWCHSISGPGDIIVPEEDSFGETILLSRKTCIYELPKHDGSPKIIKARDQIRFVRYMAYTSNRRTLCLLVENNILNEDELSFYKFIDSEVFNQAQCATLAEAK